MNIDYDQKLITVRDTLLNAVFENFINRNDASLTPENLTCIHPDCGGSVRLEEHPITYADGSTSQINKRPLLVCDRCGITSPEYSYRIKDICNFWDKIMRSDAHIYWAIRNNKLFCSTCMEDNYVLVKTDEQEYNIVCAQCYSKHGYSNSNTGNGKTLELAIKNYIDNNAVIGNRK